MADGELHERADRAGVATGYHDWGGRWVEVSDDAIERVLDVLGDAERTPFTGSLGHIPRVPDRRIFGWQIQLYQLISDLSWGIGDYRDLAMAARSFAAGGADCVLVNPLHAVSPPPPGQPIQASPYFPSSRRFSDQLGIAIERLPEYLSASHGLRASVDALKPAMGDLIDRDAVWAAKRQAFRLLAPAEAPLSDPALVDFGVFCALSEVHGTDWREWPEELQRPGTEASEAADPKAVSLHVWIQLRAREQLLAAQEDAVGSGMAVGLIHDLAVGVDPGGADAWLNQDDLAGGFTVGAPPDSFNQRGQDWGLPPWRPDRLAATDYQPFRDVVKAALTLGGGLRVDHVMGLFRLWWVPSDGSAADGAYVSYDGRAMLSVVAEEAIAANAVVIGEDLGTVAPETRDGLTEAGVLGSAVLWFATDDEDHLLPPGEWREAAAASISTHDLPTAAGQITGEPARVRHDLGQLGHSLETEQARAAKSMDDLLGRLRAEGLLAGDPPYDETAVVLAMHRYLFRTPSRIVLLSPADAVGDLQQPNLPGTTEEYPNWRLPLKDRYGRALGLEGLIAHPGTAHLAALAREELEDLGSTGRNRAENAET